MSGTPTPIASPSSPPEASFASPYDALAPYYDLIAGRHADDIPLYRAYARRVDAPVLDLGVGTGRVAVPLAQAGARVVGVDSSAAMLARARERAERAGVTLDLVHADLCRYTFPERFGLILCAADSFLHLSTPARQREALRRAREHLAPEGRLILDLPAPASGGWSDWEPGVRPLELLWSGPAPAGGQLQHIATYTADAAAQVRRMTHIVDVTGADGVVRRTMAGFDLRFVFPGELALLIEVTGLRLDALYGGYDLEPFDAASERMIAVAARL